MSSGKKSKSTSGKRAPSECEVNKWYKTCVWAQFTGTGWFCTMPTCVKAVAPLPSAGATSPRESYGFQRGAAQASQASLECVKEADKDE